MNWPIWVPRLFIISSMARSGGRASWLKNSRTPRQSPRKTIGTANAECKPSSWAAARRGELASRAISGIQAGWPSAQTRPGSPTATLVGQLAGQRLEPGADTVGRCHKVAQRSRWVCDVDSPEGAEVPVEALADGFEDLGVGLGRRIGLGQNARRLVLRRQSPLGFLSPGDIVEDDDPSLQLPVSSRRGRPVTRIYVPSSRLG